MNAGFRVSEAADGDTALTMVARELPALVLLDVKLPGIKGTAVCPAIKADPTFSGTLVILTSAALISDDDRLRAIDSGADGYLAPFPPPT